MKCRNCKHLFITHEPKTPYGCKAFSIKSARLPEVAIKAANNGQECMGFEAKAQKKKEKDLRESKYW